jgi:hypothetical protein
VARLDLVATRDDRVLAQASFAASAPFVSVAGVPHGSRTVVRLDGVTNAGDVVARGRTCPVDFTQGGSVPLYFAPTNFFAPTVGAPALTRTGAIVVPLSDGDVLVAGGADAGGALGSAELYSTASATFGATSLALDQPRREAEVVLLPNVGALITGGLDAQDQPVATAEIYVDAQKQLVPLTNVLLDARVGHRTVLLTDGRVLVTGGRSASARALATTVFVRVQAATGTAQVLPGPPLATARYQHAAVVAVGVPVVIGGYALDGTPLAGIEALQPADAATPAAFVAIASLRFARAEATASLLGDGSIFVVGGAGDSAGTPRADAELYNPITRTTTIFPLAAARRAHTATVLPDGRVLVAGGVGGDGQPLSSVELFAPPPDGVGFVSERPLRTPRAGHVAVPLCDGTVLVVGGAPGAEIYTPPGP